MNLIIKEGERACKDKSAFLIQEDYASLSILKK